MRRLLNRFKLQLGALWSTLKISYLLDQCIRNAKFLGGVQLDNQNRILPILQYDPLVDYVSGHQPSAVAASWGWEKFPGVVVNTGLLTKGEPYFSAFVYHEFGHILHGDLFRQTVKHQNPIGQLPTEIMADNFAALHGYAQPMIDMLKEMKERVKVPWYINPHFIYDEIDARVDNLTSFISMHGDIPQMPLNIRFKEEKDRDHEGDDEGRA